MTTLLLAVFLVFAVFIGAGMLATYDAIRSATKPPTHAAPFTHADPRCREVERRLDDARRAMIARGVKLLLVNREPWPRVSAGNVTSFRGRS